MALNDIARAIDMAAPEYSAVAPSLQSEQATETDDLTSRLIRESRLASFKASCPEQFRAKIDRSLIPCPAAWDRADEWQFGFPGLWLWSKQTGTAKTRMAWRIVGRSYVERGKTYLVATAPRFAEHYFAWHMDGNPVGFYRETLRHDLVVVDDIEKLDTRDERSARMLRELFDELYARKRPCIVTANVPIAHFEKVLGPSTARRMRECCAEIHFGK